MAVLAGTNAFIIIEKKSQGIRDLDLASNIMAEVMVWLGSMHECGVWCLAFAKAGWSINLRVDYGSRKRLLVARVCRLGRPKGGSKRGSTCETQSFWDMLGRV